VVSIKKEPPTDKVIAMKKQGLSNSQIIDSLRQQTYNEQQISDALAQSDIKDGVEIPDFNPDLIDAPSPSYSEENFEFPEPPTPPSPLQSAQPNVQRYQPTPNFVQPGYTQDTSRIGIERMEEIVESVVQEKWDDLIRNIGDIAIWKEKVKTDILSIKQELIRTQERFETLQKAILSKVSEYGKGVSDVGTEMKALEKVLEKIIEPLTTNIKELDRVTKELKKKK